MTCKTSEINITQQASQSLPNIPGYGTPSAINLPESPYKAPTSQPEDMNELIKLLTIELPTSTQSPNLSKNNSKDVTDALFSLMEQASPFMNGFKMITPVLQLLQGILNVICSLINPFSMGSAISKLFTEDIPPFIKMYPPFSMAITLLSIIKVVIKIIDYFMTELVGMVKEVKDNLDNFGKAIEHNDVKAAKAISNKIKGQFCRLGNLLVMFSMIGAITDIINLMLNIVKIPCGDDSSCCGPDYCPAFLREEIISNSQPLSGNLQYFSDVNDSTITNIRVPFFGTLSNNIRNHKYQLFDNNQDQVQKFINMVDAFDVTSNPKPIYYPTDSIYTGDTVAKFAPYTVSVRVYYRPGEWGRLGGPRYIRFKDCIVIDKTSPTLTTDSGGETPVANGVITISGGKGYEDDGVTPLMGWNNISHQPTSTQASLETFLYQTPSPAPLPAINMPVDYDFVPNHDILAGKALITFGCLPKVRKAKEVMKATLPIPSIPAFPHLDLVRAAMQHQIDLVQQDLNQNTMDIFNGNMQDILNNLGNTMNDLSTAYFDIAFSRYESSFSINPVIQWTGQLILVTIVFKDVNGNIISNDLSTTVINHILPKLKIKPSLGIIEKVEYDGTSAFVATLTSLNDGNGTLGVVYDNQVFATIVPNPDPTIASTVVENTQKYTFIRNISMDQLPRRTNEDVV